MAPAWAMVAAFQGSRRRRRGAASLAVTAAVVLHVVPGVGAAALANVRRRTAGLAQAAARLADGAGAAAAAIPQWRVDAELRPEQAADDAKRQTQEAADEAKKRARAADEAAKRDAQRAKESDEEHRSKEQHEKQRAKQQHHGDGSKGKKPGAAGHPDEQRQKAGAGAKKKPTEGAKGAVAPTDLPIVVASEEELQQCPQVRLTSTLDLAPGYVSFFDQHGGWRMNDSEVVLGSWSQNFLTSNWANVVFYDMDGRAAYKAEETSLEELRFKFDWKAKSRPANFGNITALQDEWEAAETRDAPLRAEVDPGDPSVARVRQRAIAPTRPRNSTLVSLTDCQGRLLFVVELQQSTKNFLGTIDVYDRAGALAAHSLTESRVARLQFVDPHGYLLATAEAPKVNASFLFVDLPKDPARGGMLTYQIHVEQGGYAGASRLLEIDYRWALVAAVQLRAIADGREVWAPSLPEASPLLYWATVAFLAAAVALACACALRPSSGSASGGKLSRGEAMGMESWKPARTLA